MDGFFVTLLHEFKTPLTNPVLIFSLILFIILIFPILLKKINIPGIIGLIIAETYPDHEASKGVMLKNNLIFAGSGSEAGVIRFELKKDSYFSKQT